MEVIGVYVPPEKPPAREPAPEDAAPAQEPAEPPSPDGFVSPWAEVGGGYALYEQSKLRVDGAPNDAKTSLILRSRQNVLSASNSAAVSSGSPPIRLQPGDHSRVAPAGTACSIIHGSFASAAVVVTDGPQAPSTRASVTSIPASASNRMGRALRSSTLDTSSCLSWHARRRE